MLPIKRLGLLNVIISETKFNRVGPRLFPFLPNNNTRVGSFFKFRVKVNSLNWLIYCQNSVYILYNDEKLKNVETALPLILKSKIPDDSLNIRWTNV